MRINKIYKGIKIFLLVVLLAIVLVFLYFVFVPHANDWGISTPAKLYVNGQLLEEKNASIYHYGKTYFAQIPFTAVLEGIGCRVSWDDQNVAQIETEDEVFTLSGVTLSDSGGKIISHDEGFQGSVLNKKGSEYELFMESEKFNRVIQRMGIEPLEIEFFPKKHEIVITSSHGQE